MNRQKALKVLNPLLFLLFLLQATSAVGARLGWYALFTLVHKPVGFALIIVGIVHLVLNWQWVKSVLFGATPKKKAA
jgi:hypothetical protein